EFLDRKFIYSLEHTHNIVINPNIFKRQQVGNSIRYKTLRFEDKHFKIDDDDPYDGRISIITPNETDCVTVFVHKRLRLAIIHNMYYEAGCAKEGFNKSKGGDVLMKLMLRFLIMYKGEYKIDRIILADHSYLSCEDSPITIKLARLRMITHGQPWYMKYGFKPYNAQREEPDDEALVFWLKYNNDMLETLPTLAVVNVYQIAQTIKNLNINALNRLIIKYPLFKDFINVLASKLQKHCQLIEAILEDIYKATPLHTPMLYDFYKSDFYLDIFNL
ncbi:MAG: hypothetical protein Barrevirus25_1, partial [Barrevirus sp.]